ncbi:hypothetical protein KJ693_04685 [bacterium]|nr:hypothetical protein [bacterium]
MSGCFPQREKAFLGIKNYACYYGQGRISDLAKYDLVILQPGNYSKEEIDFLKSNDTLVLGYLSIGEDHPLRKGDGEGPGGYASWYLDHFSGEGWKKAVPDSFPDKHKGWVSYLVNPADPNWQDFVIKGQAREMIEELGFDGLFLDTLWYPPQYPEHIQGLIKQGVIELTRGLKKAFTRNIIVANNGWVFLKELSPYLDGIMYESFSSSGEKHSEDGLLWTGEQAKKINLARGYPEKSKMPVLALDYINGEDLELMTFDCERACAFGFIPGISYNGSYLTDLCLVNPVNEFKANRQGEGVLLTWDAPGKYLKESIVDHFVIKRSSKPILKDADFKEASLISDKIPNNATSLKDIEAPGGTLYYALWAINRGGMELVGRLTTQLKEEE